MMLIEGVALSQLCDYSFGDQSGQWGNIYTSFMKEANLTNIEFVSKVFEVKKSRSYMTLFIDNIRLYKRYIKEVNESDRPYINALHEKNNLLHLCSFFPDMRFIIFTNLEDTPIDEYIFDLIPDNVLRICAVNAVSYGGKVISAPYGVQRRMNPLDDRIEILKEQMEKNNLNQAYKLLHVNINENSHSERKGLIDKFKKYSWAVADIDRVDYSIFLEKMKSCKFVLCPRGNAIDCHRNWEVLYMRRVPVMKRTSYLEHLFKDYPVLFVDDYSQVTEELLLKNNKLFIDAQKMDITRLDLNNFFDIIVKDVK
jgi:hypothetical protein